MIPRKNIFIRKVINISHRKVLKVRGNGCVMRGFHALQIFALVQMRMANQTNWHPTTWPILTQTQKTILFHFQLYWACTYLQLILGFSLPLINGVPHHGAHSYGEMLKPTRAPQPSYEKLVNQCFACDFVLVLVFYPATYLLNQGVGAWTDILVLTYHKTNW